VARPLNATALCPSCANPAADSIRASAFSSRMTALLRSGSA
jgi:hypothetical protein